MIKIGGSHKCPNYDLCKNQGSTDPEKKNHWAEKSCPKQKQQKTAANVINSENPSTSKGRYGLRNSTQVKVGTIFKSAINMVKSLSSNLLATKKESHHQCANFEKCKGQGNIEKGRNKHYKTTYCPFENEKEGLNINKKQIELENASRVYIRQVELEVTNDLQPSSNDNCNTVNENKSSLIDDQANHEAKSNSLIQDDDENMADDEIQSNQLTRKTNSNSIIQDDDEPLITNSHAQKREKKDKVSYSSKMNKMVEPIARRLSASASIIFK